MIKKGSVTMRPCCRFSLYVHFDFDEVRSSIAISSYSLPYLVPWDSGDLSLFFFFFFFFFFNMYFYTHISRVLKTNNSFRRTEIQIYTTM